MTFCYKVTLNYLHEKKETKGIACNNWMYLQINNVSDIQLILLYWVTYM